MRVRQRFGLAVLGPAALGLLLGLAGEGRADFIIYNSNGFESPTFAPGPLSGQDGWSQDNGSTSAITVQTSVVKTGSQAVAIAASGQPDFTRAYHIDSFDTSTNPEKFVDIKLDLFVSSTGTPSGHRVTGFDGAGNSIGSLVIVPNGELGIQGNGIFFPSGITVSRGVWNNYDLQLDFTDRTLSLAYNGSVVETGIPFATGSDQVFLAPALEVVPGGTGTDVAYVDNLSVTASVSGFATAVPEPASLTLLGLGALGLAVASRRRRAA